MLSTNSIKKVSEPPVRAQHSASTTDRNVSSLTANSHANTSFTSSLDPKAVSCREKCIFFSRFIYSDAIFT